MASITPNFNETMCVICWISFSSSTDTDVSTVTKGVARLIEYSDKLGDTELHEYLLTNPLIVKIHNSCRRNYTSKWRYKQKCAKDAAVPDQGSQPK